jgi:protein-L-isoaspartate(D-aspartate) O-methyltransferase
MILFNKSSQTFNMHILKLTIIGLFCVVVSIVLAQDNNDALLDTLVDEINTMVIDTQDYIGFDTLDSTVIEAIRKVPRHKFVPDIYKPYAYENWPLPIGNNQTISKPYIVALMTHLAMVNKESIVMEVGTGSGYQAAVLAELVKHVYSIEIIESLGIKARKVLNDLGMVNVTVKIGDGYNGWIEHAPFDAIIVTAAPDKVPQELIDQLKPGGRLIIPVGPQSKTQYLQVLIKNNDGTVEERDVLPVGFVLMKRAN